MNGGLASGTMKPVSNGCKPDNLPKKSRRLTGRSKNQKRNFRKKRFKDDILLSSNVVVNLSSFKLSLAEISVINKGLGFVPSYLKPKFDIINNDLLRFERKLQLFYFFKNKSDTEEDDQQSTLGKPLLQSNSTWWPRKLNGHITRLCFNIKHSIFSLLDRHKVKFNLTRAEVNALKRLRHNRDIILKKADKGGGIAVLDTELYLSKINTLLSDTNTYRPAPCDDTEAVKNEADQYINTLHSTGFLSSKQAKYLTKFKPRCPIFYGLPKIHKTDIPLRPICSQIDGPTSKINELVDKYLFIAEKNIPFLLQDTTAYLLLLDKYKKVSPGTLLVTMDVTSLYTNIPHIEGTDWVCDFYEETLSCWAEYCSVLQPVNKNMLHELILFILMNCTFDFNGHKYTQLYGTTMGARFSVKFANIYMHMWLSKFVGAYTGIKPRFIARLIDDCFFLWTDGVELLNDFVCYLNNCHSTIKFEVLYSSVSVNFLDTVTYIIDDTIHTRVYTKPTDKKQYLHFQSSHPRHTCTAIPYSQAIRYRRIIDEDYILHSELINLSNNFMARGYPLRLLNNTVDRVKTMSRESVLAYKDKTLKKSEFDKFLRGRSFLPLIIPFHQSLEKNLRTCVDTHWLNMIEESVDISKVFADESPQIVFKRGITLGNLLTSSKFSKFTDCHDSLDRDTIDTLVALESMNSNSSFDNVGPCGHPTCKCCIHIKPTSTYMNSDNTERFPIKGVFNCNSKHVVYVISCTKCGKLYVGQTARMLKDRLNNHRSDIKLMKSTAIACHFNEPLHSIKDLNITPIADISDIDISDRNKIEYNYMMSLNTIYPIGLNNYPLIE